MLITLDLPHVFFPGASRVGNAYALRALLNCLVSLDQAYLATAEAENIPVPALYRSGVYYDRTEVWDTTPALYKRGYGDCKSLSACLVAEYRQRHISCRTVFRWNPTADDGHDFHILVQTPKGFEDPSKILGMGKNENGPSRNAMGADVTWMTDVRHIRTPKTGIIYPNTHDGVWWTA